MHSDEELEDIDVLFDSENEEIKQILKKDDEKHEKHLHVASGHEERHVALSDSVEALGKKIFEEFEKERRTGINVVDGWTMTAEGKVIPTTHKENYYASSNLAQLETIEKSLQAFRNMLQTKGIAVGPFIPTWFMQDVLNPDASNNHVKKASVVFILEAPNKFDEEPSLVYKPKSSGYDFMFSNAFSNHRNKKIDYNAHIRNFWDEISCVCPNFAVTFIEPFAPPKTEQKKIKYDKEQTLEETNNSDEQTIAAVQGSSTKNPASAIDKTDFYQRGGSEYQMFAGDLIKLLRYKLYALNATTVILVGNRVFSKINHHWNIESHNTSKDKKFKVVMQDMATKPVFCKLFKLKTEPQRVLKLFYSPKPIYEHPNQSEEERKKKQENKLRTRKLFEEFIDALAQSLQKQPLILGMSKKKKNLQKDSNQEQSKIVINQPTEPNNSENICEVSKTPEDDISILNNDITRKETQNKIPDDATKFSIGTATTTIAVSTEVKKKPLKKMTAEELLKKKTKDKEKAKKAAEKKKKNELWMQNRKKLATRNEMTEVLKETFIENSSNSTSQQKEKPTEQQIQNSDPTNNPHSEELQTKPPAVKKIVVHNAFFLLKAGALAEQEQHKKIHLTKKNKL